jgi:uncharacterized ParB-like nuclease family protein
MTAAPTKPQGAAEGGSVQKNIDRNETLKPEVARTLAVGSTRVNVKGGVETLMEIPMDQVDRMPGNRMFEEAIQKHTDNPSPVDIEIRQEPNSRYKLYDGHHRFEALRRQGAKTIRAWVSKSGLEDRKSVV